MSTILLIDDDPAVLGFIETVLVTAGHRVVRAADGDQGLARFDEARPALVVTDLLMPGKEGIETIRELRLRAPEVPIIAISGGGLMETFDFLGMAQRLGATEVLSKPFSGDELLAVVDRCLRAP